MSKFVLVPISKREQEIQDWLYSLPTKRDGTHAWCFSSMLPPQTCLPRTNLGVYFQRASDATAFRLVFGL
jgi:hypothetical protein